MSHTSNKPNIKQVNCPTCQKIVPWNDKSPFRPFCSRQCQLIDFGGWAAEQNRIPVEEHDNLSFRDDSSTED